MPTPAPNDLIRLQRWLPWAISPGGDRPCLEALEPQAALLRHLKRAAGDWRPTRQRERQGFNPLPGREIYPRSVTRLVRGLLRRPGRDDGNAETRQLGRSGGTRRDLPVSFKTFSALPNPLPILAIVSKLDACTGPSTLQMRAAST